MLGESVSALLLRPRAFLPPSVSNLFAALPANAFACVSQYRMLMQFCSIRTICVPLHVLYLHVFCLILVLKDEYFVCGLAFTRFRLMRYSYLSDFQRLFSSPTCHAMPRPTPAATACSWINDESLSSAMAVATAHHNATQQVPPASAMKSKRANSATAGNLFANATSTERSVQVRLPRLFYL